MQEEKTCLISYPDRPEIPAIIAEAAEATEAEEPEETEAETTSTTTTKVEVRLTMVATRKREKGKKIGLLSGALIFVHKFRRPTFQKRSRPVTYCCIRLKGVAGCKEKSNI